MGRSRGFQMRSRRMLLEVVLGLIAVSCAGGESSDTTGPPHESTITPATFAPATTTTSTEQAESASGPFPAGEPVDLLVMSDSSGIGLAERYALFAAEALDREIRVHDLARGGRRLTETLNWMRSIAGTDIVAEAEIIVVYGFPGGLEYNLPEPNILSCFEAADAVLEPGEYVGDWTPGAKWEPTPAVATVEDWQPYRDVFDQVYNEIWKLREGQPTIIRTYDIPLGYLAPWTELGIESECTANWESQFQVVREAAEANGAGFVSVMDVFNGPNHDEDPFEKGWMFDSIHPNDEGFDIIAELLTAYGYEVSQPPT